MRLDQQAIGAGGYRRESERSDEVGPAASVTRIDDDRKMCLGLEHRDRRDVERVARCLLVRTNSALTKNELSVAGGCDVLGRHRAAP